ncbi:MAG TPA: hypothetical protein VFE58_15735 [Tepidisphaeraceae bacterium]|nr:hypothetical protein [Tepidisphaeraceae bacterium]
MGTILRTFPFLTGITGLAFDGQYLYATNVIVQNDTPVTELYTVDPDNAEILHSTSVDGGQLAGLAVAIPEPVIAAFLPLGFLFRRRSF